MKLAPTRLRFIMCAFVTILLVAMASPAMALIWNAAEVIAPTDNSENRETPTLAVQKNGMAHLAYSKYRGKRRKKAEIVYKTNRSGLWQETVITSNGVPDETPRISVYAGKPRIVFRRGKAATKNSEIVYMIKTDGVWKLKKISNNDYPDDYPAIATYKGKDHVVWASYRGGITGDGDIYYKTNATDGGKWRRGKVTNNNLEEAEPDIAVNGLRRAHIVFTRIDTDGDKEIVYASKRPGRRWNIQRVTANDGIDDDSPAIALYKGKAYIAFYRTSSINSVPQLYLAKKVRGGWRIQRLSKDPGGVYGKPWIKVNRGVVRVVFTRFTKKTKTLDVYYLRKSKLVKKKRRIDKKGDHSRAWGISVAKGLSHVVYESWNSNTNSGGIYYRKQR